MDSNNASLYRERGECYIKLGNSNLEMAIDDFRTVVRLEKGPHLREDIDRLIQILIDHEKYDDAIKELSFIDDTGAELIRLGDELKNKKKKVNGACTCYSAAIEMKHGNASCHQKRGQCYMIMKMYSEAVSDFRLAMDLNPQIDNGAYYLTKALFHADQRTEAMEVSTTLDYQYLKFLGTKFLEEERFQDCLDCFNEALRKNSESAFSYAKRGICNKMMGNREAAMSDFRDALRLQSEDDDIHDIRKSVQLDMCEVFVESSQHDKAMEVITELEANANKYKLTPSDFNRINIARQTIREDIEVGSGHSPIIISPR